VLRYFGDGILTILKLGEFVGGGEPEFQGMVQITEATEANAGESAVGGFLETLMVFRGSGLFECEQGFLKAVREALGGNQGGC